MSVTMLLTDATQISIQLMSVNMVKGDVVRRVRLVELIKVQQETVEKLKA
jgi:hypothetical protein